MNKEQLKAFGEIKHKAVKILQDHGFTRVEAEEFINLINEMIVTGIDMNNTTHNKMNKEINDIVVFHNHNTTLEQEINDLIKMNE